MESVNHVKLVELIDEVVRESCDVSRLFYCSDTLGEIGKKVPPAISGYIPDVAYQDISGDYKIIGEAKTSNDINTDHTKMQTKAYLWRLKLQGDGLLVVSVPPGCETQMNGLLRSICREEQIEEVKYQTISPMDRRGLGTWR